MNKIPIIIPFKETSVRCPNKNFILFPYVIKWLDKQNINHQNIYVVSSSNKVEDFISQYNIKYIYEHNHQKSNDTLAAAYTAKDLNVENYFLLPITQPIRSTSLINNISTILVQENNPYDFITTHQLITDRSLFYLTDDDKFITPSYNRKGCMCKEVKMIDGAIYGIKTSFSNKIINSTDINHDFWSGNFKTIENSVDFFLDIDTQKDMKKFNILNRYNI